MHEIADRLLAAAAAGHPIAVATAISVEGSAPRTVGTSMAYDGIAVIGSIAGGCVEGAVVDACEEVLADGRPRTVEYGVDDETAFSVGLTCGGQLRIHVQLLDDRLLGALRESQPLEVCRDYTEPAPVQRRMIIVGAMEFSAALSAAARMLGYAVTVCDPRPLFATPERFPGASVVVQWPTEYLRSVDLDNNTAVCVLSHDWRFDSEVLAMALSSGAGYVGAMGSRRTHERRVASLKELGVGGEAIARLHSPIGLDVGASTPEETAVSILAEVLAVRTGASTRSLASTQGPIHSGTSLSVAPRAEV
ncbi:xanthine dehydrogenase accessory factor [Microbacteriaceae bacterium SG_E_30_P1]|uniref:Xanthine dehydrogenase accessory factor n=1 Tax=Antiquaquibacter oligotrophicus TaxID=2880260 RepID=A0ABT6KQR7_9MICO|nr:XdhC/CoxI family protein [Antiquaquibacter oligotrophicus]MDH6181547.1 xanthine dehydrogenase accessory factor [Antiquaquibacter oligotrophicus]UDF12764.1 XdhC family protein [Antiquaquibacter oligotrophicus]